MLDAMLPIRIAAALALAVSIAACSEDSTTAPPDGTATGGSPKAGSTYRFVRFEADTTGASIPGSSDTATTTLVATSAQLAGESSVSVFVQGSDTTLLHQASSGDVQYYPKWAGAIRSGWITLPIATKATTEKTLRDTTVDLGGGATARASVTMSVGYVSSEKVVVAGESLDAHRVRIRIIEINPLSAELNLVDTTTQTLLYAPKIGYFARLETARSQQQPFATVVFPAAVAELTAYELK
jgi:hypothetical protein